MWNWLRWLFPQTSYSPPSFVPFPLPATPHPPQTLAELLEPHADYEDLRMVLRDARFLNPHLPVPKRDVSKITQLVLHCTADDDHDQRDVYGVAEYDVSPACHINPGVGCPSITYHYYIEMVSGICTVFWCLDHDVKAWHVGDWNGVSLGVAIDYDGSSELPAGKWVAAAKTMAWLCRAFGLPVSAVTFHRELPGTGWNPGPHGEKVYRKTCPGTPLDLYLFRDEVAKWLRTL